MYDITSTIVTYNTNVQELELAISSFLNTCLNVKIYIVDNSPTDCLSCNLCSDKRVEYIFTGTNNGFGAGHNVILSQKEKLGKYHIILNPDIQFKEGVLESLYDYMECNSDVGNVMPRVVYPNGEIQNLCKLLPTPIDLIGRFILPFKSLKYRLNYKFEMHFAQMNKEMNVPYLSGCFMFLRKEAIEKVGLFDDKFFMYVEDVDLSRRIHMSFRTMYYPNVTIIHRHDKASFRNYRLMKAHIKSAIYYFNKWGWIFDKDRRIINKKAKDAYSLR